MLNLLERQVIVNISAFVLVLITFYLSKSLLKEYRQYLCYSLMFFLIYRSVLVVPYYTLDLALAINIGVGLFLYILFVLDMLRIRTSKLNPFFSVLLLLFFFYLFKIGRISFVALLSYVTALAVLTPIYMDRSMYEFLYIMTFSMSWLSDVKELSIILYRDAHIHVPTSFTVMNKYLVWLALLPVLARKNVIRRDRVLLTIGLVLIVMANILQLFDWHLNPVDAKVFALFIRLIPLASIICLLKTS